MNQPPRLARSIRLLMDAAAVPGATLALVDNREVKVLSMGATEREGGRLVSEKTVFDVASLSKPVVAYIALQLADSGALGLDTPLSKIVQKGVPPQLACEPITARHVLTHTSGLPNLRGDRPLKVHFPPGSRFSYSSVGFAYLQLALETAAAAPLEAIAKRLVFDALDMPSSSFEWQPRLGDDAAFPHEGERRLDKHRPAAARAAYSLQTTAADYGKFMAAVLRGTALKEATHRSWLAPAVMVPRREAVHLEASPLETERGIGWGLGWGVETGRGTFFQWGKMDGIRAFAMGCLHTQSAVVVLTNSSRGLRLMDTAATAVLPGAHPALAWLRACVTE